MGNRAVLGFRGVLTSTDYRLTGLAHGSNTSANFLCNGCGSLPVSLLRKRLNKDKSIPVVPLPDLDCLRTLVPFPTRSRFCSVCVPSFSMHIIPPAWNTDPSFLLTWGSISERASAQTRAQDGRGGGGGGELSFPSLLSFSKAPCKPKPARICSGFNLLLTSSFSTLQILSLGKASCLRKSDANAFSCTRTK